MSQSMYTGPLGLLFVAELLEVAASFFISHLIMKNDIMDWFQVEKSSVASHETRRQSMPQKMCELFIQYSNYDLDIFITTSL